MKSAICIIVKNEQNNIQEWIAFHSVIGFDTIILIDNNSEDYTVATAKTLNVLFDIRIFDLPHKSLEIQALVYEQVCRDYAHEFDWIAFADADEFLVPRSETHIGGLLERFDNAAAILLPWLVFGSNGYRERPPGLVIDTFQRRSTKDFHANRHVKSIVRPRLVRSGLNPHCFQTDGEQRLPDGTHPRWQAPGVLQDRPWDCDWNVHHYFTRSRAHWADRLKRGQLGESPRDWAVFAEYDRNEIHDASAARFAAAVKFNLAHVPTIGSGVSAHLGGRVPSSASARR